MRIVMAAYGGLLHEEQDGSISNSGFDVQMAYKLGFSPVRRSCRDLTLSPLSILRFNLFNTAPQRDAALRLSHGVRFEPIVPAVVQQYEFV